MADPKATTVHLEDVQTVQSSTSKPSFFAAKSVLSVPLQEAIVKQNPKVFTWATCRLYTYMMISMMVAWANGYDGSLMSGINAMPQYQVYFGTEMTGGSTGIVFAIYFIGNIVAAPFTGPLSDHFGRRWGMWLGCLFIAAGACAQGSSTNIHGFMGGRFCCGFGVGLAQASGITYIAEIAHPAWRSAFTSMFNTFYFVGAFVVSWVTYGTLNIQTSYAWRIPIYLQCFAAGVVLFAAPFIPESPRWMLAHGHREKALNMLAKYHGEGDPESPIVKLEMEEMTADINVEGRDKVWWDYRPLFNTREARARLICVVGMAFLGQWAGNGAVTYFLPAMLDQAGIKSSREQILYNAILNTLAYPCGAFAALFIAGRFGRRQIFITASLIFAVEFVIITALTGIYSKPQYLAHPNTSASKATVAFIFLFRLTYSLTITPLHPVYPVECFAFESRAKGEGFFTIADSSTSVFNTYVTPIGLKNAQWKFYFLYIIWDALIPIVIYFFFVETHGRTLEELTGIFRARNPVKASLEHKKMAVMRKDDKLTAVVLEDESSA